VSFDDPQRQVQTFLINRIIISSSWDFSDSQNKDNCSKTMFDNYLTIFCGI